MRANYMTCILFFKSYSVESLQMMGAGDKYKIITKGVLATLFFIYGAAPQRGAL
jgi:hypothetical protein